MEPNPYVSPATTETKLETPSIVQGGDLRAVAKGLRYLGFGGVAGTVGTLAAILLDQFNPDTPGGYVWLLIGSQLVTAGTAVIGLILCIDSPSAARGRGLVAVALAINVAACFACVAVLGGIATSPLITILIVIASTVSTGCCIIFSHRLATALDHPQLASRILLLMIGFLIWIATTGLFQIVPSFGAIVFCGMGAFIAWGYFHLLLEIATLADSVEQLRQAAKWRAPSYTVERLLNEPTIAHVTPEPAQEVVIEGPLPVVAVGIRCIFWSTMVNMVGTAGVAYFVQSGDSRVIANVLPFALGSQAIAAISLFAGLVLCLVGAPGKIRFQLLLVGAIIGDFISILLGVVVVLGVIQHPAILFLGAAFGLLGWGSLLTFFHGLALELGSRETANHCVLLTIATVVWMATSFVLLFSVPLAFILLVGIGLFVMWRYLTLLLTLANLAKGGGVAPPVAG